MLLITEIKRLKASRVVIDSLSGFELALAPTFREDFRESLLRLVSALASTGVTVLMTSELEDRYTELASAPMAPPSSPTRSSCSATSKSTAGCSA